MGVPASEICDLASLGLALARPDGHPVMLVIDGPVPAWLADGVALVRRAHRPLRVRVGDPDDRGEVRDGREIAMTVALLDAGVQPAEVEGVHARRVRRVAEVLARWDGGRGGPEPSAEVSA